MTSSRNASVRLTTGPPNGDNVVYARAYTHIDMTATDLRGYGMDNVAVYVGQSIWAQERNAQHEQCIESRTILEEARKLEMVGRTVQTISDIDANAAKHAAVGTLRKQRVRFCPEGEHRMKM